MRKYSYVFAYIVFMVIPASIFSYFAFKSFDFRALTVTIVVSLFIGGIFDIWATRHGKKDKFYIWEYNRKTILGVKLFGVPIEDFFLFLTPTPILIISLWETIKNYLQFHQFNISSLVILSITVIIYLFTLVFKLARK